MSSSQSSAAVGDDETECGISTVPGVEGEIVPLPVASVVSSVVSVVTVGDRTVQIVEVVEPRVDVPEGGAQASRETGEYWIRINILVTHLWPLG